MSLRRRNRGRGRSVVAILILLSITLIALDHQRDLGPLNSTRGVVRDSLISIGDTLGKVVPGDGRSSNALKAENARLKTQLDEAQGRLAQVENTERERRSLLDLANLPAPVGASKVTARVTNLNVSNYDARIEIDKGSDAGVSPGMPVVTGLGLVGRIAESSRYRSTILVVGDTTSNVGVRIGLAGDIGVASGQGATKDLTVDLIDRQAPINLADIAVTSGLTGSPFPPGIPVGRVSRADTTPQMLRKDVQLDPLIDVGRLDFVSVLQWRPA